MVAAVDDAFAMRWVDGVTLRDHPTPDAWHDTGAQIRIAHDLDGGGPPFGTGFGGFEPEQPTWRAFFEVFAESMLRGCERDLDFPAAPAARIRAALHAAAPRARRAPPRVVPRRSCNPSTCSSTRPRHDVMAIIDWADKGSGDIGWDVAVLTIDHASAADAFLDGYGAGQELRTALDQLLPLYKVVRLVGEAGWFAEHGFPPGENLQRAIDWRP